MKDESTNNSSQKSGSTFSQNAASGSKTASTIELPKIELPKGGGAIKGIEEKFQVNAVSGTSSFSIPIPLSPSRQGFAPDIGLSYNSGNGNSPFGIGWNLGLANITRKTTKKLPEYKDEEESDTFIYSGLEDLVPKLTEQMDGTWERESSTRTEGLTDYLVSAYRPRIEGSFARIEKWKNKTTGETHWRTVSPSNIHTYYGLTAESRIADPEDTTRVFEWLICKTHDDKGNIILYKYKPEDFDGVPKKQNETNRLFRNSQTYLKTVFYGIRSPWYYGDADPAEADFLFRVILDYGEHDTAVDIEQDIYVEKNTWACRKDPFSSHRSGFEIRTYRRCNRIMIFHCFDVPDLPHNPYLVKSLELFYDDELNLTGSGKTAAGFSFLTRARQNGHKWDANTNTYSTKYLPETELTYQQHEWNTTIQEVTTENAIHAPSGIGNSRYLWVDLFSEGIAGILTEQNGEWFYKSNLGNADFSEGIRVAPRPSFAGLGGSVSIQELEGNGIKYLAQLDQEPKGFFKLSPEEEWESFIPFESYPNGIMGKEMRAMDLNGDGKADLLITEENTLRWHAGLGETGFEVSTLVQKAIDEEEGPAILFSDREQCIFLADFCGDGLTDIARIRNGSVCYWPNLGYGRFGKKVEMDNAPFFDHPDSFNPALLRLADIDGSGTTDIIYLGKNNFRVWMNLNGNEWATEPEIINPFPEVNQLSDVSVLDFLGSGTACIVCSSSEPALANRPIRYIDLMGSKKPALLSGYKNNCGKEATIEYRSSAFYYLDDKKAGNKWITKLPFPVHCISKVTSEDKIRDCIFVSTYSYRHGYFDHIEGEFRGFARVEQLDTEEYNQFKLNAAKNVVEEIFHQPPMRSVSWFHTGAFFDKDRVLHQCKSEYFQNTSFVEYEMPEPILPEGLTVEEWREALRACKGLPLRSEIYAEDETALSPYPFSASQSGYEIRLIQPKGENEYASFQIISSEAISYGYERNPADPRINQSFILETDDLGNPRKTASVIFPRATRPIAPNEIPDTVWNEQNKGHIAYSESFFTNDIITDNVYRLRNSCESKGYEVSGIGITAGIYFLKNSLANQIAAFASVIRYDQEFSSGIELRLSSHSRAYFINDAFDDIRPLYELSPHGVIYKTHQLAFTNELVPKYYGTKVNDAMLLAAGYIHLEGDDDWWTQPGIAVYDVNPETFFYMPFKVKDVFLNETSASLDSYLLMAETATNSIGDTIHSENDYRILAPWMVTDINLNRTAVETDELGMVIKSAVMGKEGAGEGDTLGDPTSRLEYDLFNWQTNGKPNYTHTYSREQHGLANPRWQESYTYSDGSGGVIMAKAQVEPGNALKWNEITKVVDTIAADPRWLGNGRTIINNKGNVIKSFEPYFSSTHEYEDESALVETGISAIQYYDAVGRNIKTELPNGTFTKVAFDSWKHLSYDVNDTVKDSQWYIDRGSPDPDLDPEPVGDEEKRVAWLAAKHHDTPVTIHTDSRGRSFYTSLDLGDGTTTSTYSETDIAHRYSYSFDQLARKVGEKYTNLLGSTIYRVTPEKGEKWKFLDVMGRLVKRWDNNLFEARTSYDSLHRIVAHYIKENGKAELAVGYIIYGDILPDAIEKSMKGQTLLVLDQSGLTRSKKIDFKGNLLEAEKQLIVDYKNLIDWKILEGLNTIALIEAAIATQVEMEIFSTSSKLDALNRPMELSLPDASILKPTYNIGNKLDKLEVQIRGVGPFVSFMEEQDHDAKGQRQYVKLGNGMITNYFYDPKNFRLINLITKKDGVADSDSIQNLNNIFDPVGNITYTEDKAQQTYFFKNAVVKPESRFVYNAFYQLTLASGREHAGIGGGQSTEIDLPFITALPHINDATAVRTYTEEYEYDDCGNIKVFDHKAIGGNWKRHYTYEYETDPLNLTNRLKSTSAPTDPDGGPYTANYTHDTHGNMLSMPHLASMIWNFADQLREVDLGGGGTAYYVYGSSGSRSRKIIERLGGFKQERIYLGAIEIYREYQGADKRVERNTLHVSDNSGHIAQIDTKLLDTHGTDPDNPLDTDVIRYQYGNHLGSATLETNEIGQVISYEEYHAYGTSAYRSAKSGTNLSLKRYRFSGKERDDETGLHYFGARYLAAWLGRWTSSDPAGFVDGLNLYRYCRNNPVIFTDPNGTATWQTPPPVAFTPGEAGKAATIDFINNHFMIGVENGRVYRVRVHISDAIWVTNSTGSYWQGHLTGAAGEIVSSTDIGAYDSSHPPENSFEPIAPAAPAAPAATETPDAGGSPEGVAGGVRTDGPPGGTPGGTRTEAPPEGAPPSQTGGEGDDGSFSFDTSSFLGGLLAGIAVGFIIAAIIITAPISIPASVAVGAAVVGGGLFAYGTVQSLRRRDMLNRPISNEQANENLGFGIGGIIGGAAAGPTINGVRGMASGARVLASEAAEGLESLGAGMRPVPLGPGGSSGAAAIPAVRPLAVPAGATTVAGAIPQGMVAMMSDNTGGGGGGSNNEHYDLDDAAEATFGKGTKVTSEGTDIGPVKNPAVRAELEARGYDPSEFRAVQYDTWGRMGNRIMTVFEGGGVYFGPHESSANW
jgi:RHS repeat-associated protein